MWCLQLPVSDDVRRRRREKKSRAGEEEKGGYIGKRIFVYTAEKNLICTIRIEQTDLSILTAGVNINVAAG